MNINLIGKTGISILSIVVLIAMTSGISRNDVATVSMASKMFWGTLSTLFLMTLTINAPKIIKALK